MGRRRFVDVATQSDLAFDGGDDTSVIIPYVDEEWERLKQMIPPINELFERMGNTLHTHNDIEDRDKLLEVYNDVAGPNVLSALEARLMRCETSIYNVSRELRFLVESKSFTEPVHRRIPENRTGHGEFRTPQMVRDISVSCT